MCRELVTYDGTSNDRTKDRAQHRASRVDTEIYASPNLTTIRDIYTTRTNHVKKHLL
jgi:hypothetical protein